MKRLILIALFFLPLFVARADAPSVALPLCSDAVHASYHTYGPDGQVYPTWHPQIDAEHGCHFDHEHGSNPALFLAGVHWYYGSGSWPAFGYSAAQMGMSEGHAGFKAYVFRAGGYRWMLTQHQGTARADVAACVRMHTLDIRAIRESDGALVVDLHDMADFGVSVENTSGTPLTPPACPTQGAIVSAGVRQLPVGPGSVGYEPWVTRIVTGSLDAKLNFNTKNPQTACDTLTCTTTLNRGDNGAYRALTVEWLTLGGVNLLHATCVPYGADYYYDCSEAIPDESPYRLNPFVTGAN